MRMAGRVLGVLALGLLASLSGTAQGQAPGHTTIQVRMDAKLDKPVSGRLIVVAFPVETRIGQQPGGQVTEQTVKDFASFIGRLGLAPSPNPASGSAAAAMPKVTLAQGQAAEVDGDGLAKPKFSSLKPGRYFMQAILDADGDFAYGNRPTSGDVVSDVAVVDLPAQRLLLNLTRAQPSSVSNWDRPEPLGLRSPQDTEESLRQAHQRFVAAAAVKAHAERVYFASKALTAFWGKPTSIRAYVLTPPGYGAGAGRYPTVLRTEGFGATFDGTFLSLQQTWEEMASGKTPPMIWVFLDHAGPTGTNEFADSANNGPWGKALTEEFLPWLDGKYRTEGAKSRFTTGHSSGGWAALWLQVRYPKLFAGAWPTSPDPTDFHDFTNVDIYRPKANTYVLPNGSPTPLVRNAKGVVLATHQNYAQMEAVLGEAGGQMASFDWVFSPKGADGRPRPLFDRETGAVDPTVALYWRDNYDIAWRIRRDARTLKPDLDGKIHLWVGTMDTYHLDGSARLLKAALDEVGIRSDFHFVEGADHASVMFEYPDAYGLEKTIAWEMYAVARPGTKRPPYTPQPSGNVIIERPRPVAPAPTTAH